MLTANADSVLGGGTGAVIVSTVMSELTSLAFCWSRLDPGHFIQSSYLAKSFPSHFALVMVWPLVPSQHHSS